MSKSAILETHWKRYAFFFKEFPCKFKIGKRNCVAGYFPFVTIEKSQEMGRWRRVRPEYSTDSIQVRSVRESHT